MHYTEELARPVRTKMRTIEANIFIRDILHEF